MTELAFHHDIPNRLDYVCRFLRKAYNSGAQVAVLGEASSLSAVSKALWELSDTDFIAHALDDASEAQKAASPIRLTQSLDAVSHHHIALNLLLEVPQGFERFDRLIEIVGLEADERAQARARLRHYQERGYAIRFHAHKPSPRSTD